VLTLLEAARKVMPRFCIETVSFSANLGKIKNTSIRADALSVEAEWNFGSGGETRTPDLGVMNPTL